MSAPATVGYRIYRVRNAAGGLLYLGESNDPVRRLREHERNGAPWWPEFAAGGSWSIDPAVYATQAQVWRAERDAIRAERPRHNDQHNHGNPHRVVMQRGMTGLVVAPRPVARRRRPEWQVFAVALAGVWVAGAGGLWWAFAGAYPLGHALRLAAVCASVVMIGGLLWAGRRPRRRRRRW